MPGGGGGGGKGGALLSYKPHTSRLKLHFMDEKYIIFNDQRKREERQNQTAVLFSCFTTRTKRSTVGGAGWGGFNFWPDIDLLTAVQHQTIIVLWTTEQCNWHYVLVTHCSVVKNYIQHHGQFQRDTAEDKRGVLLHLLLIDLQNHVRCCLRNLSSDRPCRSSTL